MRETAAWGCALLASALSVPLVFLVSLSCMFNDVNALGVAPWWYWTTWAGLIVAWVGLRDWRRS